MATVCIPQVTFEFQPRRKKAVLLAGASPAWGIVGAPQ